MLENLKPNASLIRLVGLLDQVPDKNFEQYCKRVLYKMDPLNNLYSFRHTAFEVMLMHRKPSQINGQMFIKSKDSYWEFPPDLFDL